MSIINFSYFDQFTDMEINLAPYINDIKSNSGFEYTFSNIQPVKVTLKNLFNRTEVIDNIKKNISYFEPYVIKNGERPDSISYEFYDTVENWWIICVFNNIKNMYNDWPMTDEQLNSMTESLFNSENKYSKSTYYNLLFERNELNRNILILKPLYINDVVSAFRSKVENF